MSENEIKEKERNKLYTDSFTTGSAAKDASYKVYFDVDEEAKKDTKDTKIYKLLQLKEGIGPV